MPVKYLTRATSGVRRDARAVHASHGRFATARWTVVRLRETRIVETEGRRRGIGYGIACCTLRDGADAGDDVCSAHSATCAQRPTRGGTCRHRRAFDVLNVTGYKADTVPLK